MRFTVTEIPGVVVVELDPHRDERGFFARSFCEEEFAKAGISMRVVQTSISHNPVARTLRGIHFQHPPYEEPKLVQCVRGRLWDVAVDLRANSPTYGRSLGIELAPERECLLYIPPGCGHGFITLEDRTDVLYFMGAAFVPGAGGGILWNDPAFSISWPVEPVVISERDASYPTFNVDG
ncbi:dTDP-4-dehydrorhamnose 3,5-epimerase [Microvirga lenta]|uniref:dTDP-4-dehydrorhamnose 3,5-epimerase n=1 Tax=Microvirga lenta TaxID=2881337 RepID=UPI001CFF446B|nr:dTDP-4-dehydrorhamnose 3,5-epimerase [Microvirga lenta]MCB5173558.1 dTDP-4-dehydrorhamnose 3,5-epimerase [Microvirga lenta]